MVHVVVEETRPDLEHCAARRHEEQVGEQRAVRGDERAGTLEQLLRLVERAMAVEDLKGGGGRRGEGEGRGWAWTIGVRTGRKEDGHAVALAMESYR